MLLKLQNTFIIAALIAIPNCLTIVWADGGIVPNLYQAGTESLSKTMARANAKISAAILPEQFSGVAATNYVVNTLDNVKDGVCNAAHCSLRDAISGANADGMDSTINFSVSGIIQLDCADNTAGGSNGLPVITTPITINGDKDNDGDSDITIARSSAPGTPNFRIIQVQTDSSLELNYLTISNGNFNGSGAGIINNADLTINYSTISNHQATRGGGIYNNVNSTFTLNNSTVSENYTISFNGSGGGIFSDAATVNINNSNIVGNTGASNNQAARGGGIYQQSGILTINNSTISGNTAIGYYAGSGGGIYTEFATLNISGSTISGNAASDGDEEVSGAYGGGISAAFSTTLTIINSTISGNRADTDGGGLHSSSSTSNVSFTTFTGNTADFNNNGSGAGGGFFIASGALTIRNSLITGNSDTGGSNSDCSGSATWSGSNLVGDAGNARGCTGASNTLAGASSTALNATLADNGGSTLTHALASGSPAQQLVASGQCGVIGNETVTLPFDQRGTARPQFLLCDVGAVESTVLLPTAASISISGRVLAANGRGIANAVVTLTTPSGETRAARTNPFGYYRFNDLTVGQTVTVTGVSKRFQFAPQIINLSEDLIGLNFVAAP